MTPAGFLLLLIPVWFVVGLAVALMVGRWFRGPDSLSR
jgi:hypothetical protein